MRLYQKYNPLKQFKKPKRGFMQIAYASAASHQTKNKY